MTTPSSPCWRIAPGQQLSFEELDDGVVAYDELVGATHRLDASAAEALAVIEEMPGLEAAGIRGQLLTRLALAPDALPLAAVEALLVRFELLNLVRAAPR